MKVLVAMTPRQLNAVRALCAEQRSTLPELSDQRAITALLAQLDEIATASAAANPAGRRSVVAR